MKLLFKIILPLICAMFSAWAQETNQAAVAVPETNLVNVAQTDSTNNVVPNIGAQLGAVFKRDEVDQTRGTIARVSPARGSITRFLKDVMQGRYITGHSENGDFEETSDAILVIYDPANKVQPTLKNWDDYILGLSLLPIANKANLVVIDMRFWRRSMVSVTNNDAVYSSDEDFRKDIRETLIAGLEKKVNTRKDRKGNKLNLRALLEERQLNTIGLLALDPAKPKDLTPIHGLDAEYSDKVEGLIDEALAKYNLWLKEDAERKAKEKAEK